MKFLVAALLLLLCVLVPAAAAQVEARVDHSPALRLGIERTWELIDERRMPEALDVRGQLVDDFPRSARALGLRAYLLMGSRDLEGGAL